jgi:hypothetical protein
MCGLSGIAGDLYTRDLDAFKTLLFLGQLRGMHSTGIAAIFGGKKNPFLRLLKNTWNAQELLDLKAAGDVISTQAKVIIGHNRSATIGDITKANAHPFQFNGEFAGAHNGTLHSIHTLDKYQELDTDSEVSLYNIYKHGPEKVIPKLRGAFAFVWVDLRSQTLNFIRNAERPLHYAFDVDQRRLFWGSEQLMMCFALERSHIKTAPENTVHEFAADTLYSFKYQLVAGGKYDAESLTKTPIPPAFVPYKHYGGSVYDNSADWVNDVETNTEPVVTNLPAVIKNNMSNSNPYRKTVIPVTAYKKPIIHYKGFKGALLDEETFDMAVADGCVYCQQPIKWGERVRFVEETTALCGNCMKKPELPKVNS